MRRNSNILILCLAVVSILVSSSYGQGAKPQCSSPDRIANVMTRNLDAGSDFGYVLQAASNPNASQFDLLLAITNTYQEMIDSNIAKRAEGIANEIRAHHPDLIGLQEVTTLRTGPYGQPAKTVVVDGLQSLVKALHQARASLQSDCDPDECQHRPAGARCFVQSHHGRVHRL